MNAKAAYALLRKKKPKFEANKCIDYKEKNLFVFIPEKTLDGSFSVNKETGEIRAFQPLHNDPDKWFSIVDTNEVDLGEWDV